MNIVKAPLPAAQEAVPCHHQHDALKDSDKAIPSSATNETKQRPVIPAFGSEPDAWQRTIDKTVRSIVSVRFCHPASFDTGYSLTSEASGFIIDDERGYILTNRHVVGVGPFTGCVVFYNQEEVDAFPIYRDPIHDFGILRFDPTAVKHMDIKALSLRPDLAKVGVEIRVIGNDAGEKLSILSGFISRLDRNAPKYRGYQDFNTCYYQANAAATGGSSGSPVVNIDGYVIALQAGGRTDRASTDYFLPLHDPLRAIQHLQQDKPIPRGDIQCKFLLKPFDECRRLGLKADWETVARDAYPTEDNMLVAETVIPDGPSDDKIKEGDIIIKINGSLVTQFLNLGQIFDSNINKTVHMLLQRGGEDVEVDIMVQDISKALPDRFLAGAGATLNDLSYQMAQRYAIPRKGVYVSESGLLNLPKRTGLLIQSVDYKDTPDLDKFIEVMRDIPDKARVIITYKELQDLHTTQTSLVTINKHWSSRMKMISRNDATGVWDFGVLAEAIPPSLPTRSKASFNGRNHIGHAAVAEIVRSFVHVKCTAPFLLEGCPSKVRTGMGVIVDADKGIVLISRSFVPHRLCDVVVTVADSVIIEAKVIFLHPSHNYSLIQYDPSLLDAPVQTATLSPDRLTQGSSTLFVGYNNDRQLSYAPTTVTGVRALSFSPHSTPCYRPMNADRIDIDTRLGDECDSGIIMSNDGVVQAIWLHYEGKTKTNFGLCTSSIVPVLTQIRQGTTTKLRTLPVEFEAVPLFQTRVMGVSDEWIAQAEDHSLHHQLFMVKRVFNDEPGQLLEGDVVLTLNGGIITMASELDVMYWHETLEAVVVRRGEEVRVKLHTVADDDLEMTHMIQLCGAMISKPHLSVRQEIKKLPSEVYVACRYYGGPASRYGLWATSFITHVNDDSTPTLDSLLSKIVTIPDNTYFRVKGCSYNGVPFVITIKKNERFYPTVEWRSDPVEPWIWHRKTYEDGQILDGEGRYGIWT